MQLKISLEQMETRPSERGWKRLTMRFSIPFKDDLKTRLWLNPTLRAESPSIFLDKSGRGRICLGRSKETARRVVESPSILGIFCHDPAIPYTCDLFCSPTLRTQVCNQRFMMGKSSRAIIPSPDSFCLAYRRTIVGKYIFPLRF